jgi:hypothetical protein
VIQTLKANQTTLIRLIRSQETIRLQKYSKHADIDSNHTGKLIISKIPTPLSTQALNFKQALMDTSFAKPIPILHPMYDIPEGNEDNPSFFFTFYHQFFTNETIPFEPIEDETQLPLPFRTYNHPTFTKWDDIWNTPPIELDTDIIPNPTIDFLFQSVLYRLSLDSTYFFNQEFCTIRQGTTFTFKGYDHKDVRFVVEWLQWTHEHSAYLKVVAMTANGQHIPYFDPDYPSFILIIPLCLALVPTPTTKLTLYYSPPLDSDDDLELIEEGKDVEFCWACKNAF